MISDQTIAGNCKRLMDKRDPLDEKITIENKVFDGVRYITLAGMDSEQFRKKYTLWDFVADLRETSKENSTYVNRHFKEMFKETIKSVIDIVDEDKRIPVCIAGHGVAGSIAVLVGYYLAKRIGQYTVDRVVTFGAPAAFNGKHLNNSFEYLLQQVTTQYILPNDKLANMFRWSKYSSINKKFLVSNGGGSIESYIDSGGLMT